MGLILYCAVSLEEKKMVCYLTASGVSLSLGQTLEQTLYLSILIRQWVLRHSPSSSLVTAWILVGAQPSDWISSPFAAHLLLFLSPLSCRHQIIASLEKCRKAPCVLYPNEGHFMVAMDTWILDLKPGRVKFSYGSAMSSCVTIVKSFPLSEPQCPFS